MPVVTPAAEEQNSHDLSEMTDTHKSVEQEVQPAVDTESVNEAKIDEAEPLAYEPPFPDRENPFLTPRRGPNAIQGGVGSSFDKVQLLGFANVRGQKAILSINGMVVPIGEGGLEDGIEVISIQPPAVVLQRNKQRWQASLEY